MSRKLLITGASRGIGRATAILCGARGFAVGVNYLENAAAAARTVEEVNRAGGCAVALPGNVTIEAEVLTLFDEAERLLGPLDGVVINAGIVADASPVSEMSVARLKRMFDTNILGAFLCAREAARRLSRSRGGSGGTIVLVSSVAARLGSPGEYVDYAASKAAVDTLAIGLAKELGAEGVRVNAVRPGLIETDIHASGGQPDRAARLGRTTPLGRAGQPKEVAELIVWLLSDSASYVTGALLDVSGGR